MYMYRQLKAEFYKLIHTYVFFLLPLLFLVSFFILTRTTNGVYILYSNWGENSIGFFSFLQSSGTSYTISDLTNTIISPSWGIWILVMLLTISFFYKDYLLKTVNLSYTYGASTTTIFFSKIITVILYFSICYILFSIICCIYCVSFMSIKLNLTVILKVIKVLLLCYLIFISFSVTCIFITALTNSVLVSTTIISIGTLVSAYLLIVTWTPSSRTPFYFLLSPMYYLMSVAHRPIVSEIIIYSLFNFILLIPCSIIILKKRIVS